MSLVDLIQVWNITCIIYCLRVGFFDLFCKAVPRMVSPLRVKAQPLLLCLCINILQNSLLFLLHISDTSMVKQGFYPLYKPPDLRRFSMFDFGGIPAVRQRHLKFGCLIHDISLRFRQYTNRLRFWWFWQTFLNVKLLLPEQSVWIRQMRMGTRTSSPCFPSARCSNISYPWFGNLRCARPRARWSKTNDIVSQMDSFQKSKKCIL